MSANLAHDQERKLSRHGSFCASKDFPLWLVSQVIDYAAMLFMCWVCFQLQTSDSMQQSYVDLATLAMFLAAQGTALVLVLYIRERLHFVVLSDRVAVVKQKRLTQRDWMYVVQTAVFTMSSFGVLKKLGLMKIALPTEFLSQETIRYGSAGTLLAIYLDFLAILVLRDAFSLAPFHAWMHEHPKLYNKLHKTHHEIRHQTQSLHAFHIDLLDLVLENTAAPALLLLAKYILWGCCGTAATLTTQMHWFTGVLLGHHDGALHSVNPYSTMYFHPVLDYILKGNVMHQLHHVINKGYYVFVPYQHMRQSARQRDTDLYNQMFATDFEF